MLSMLCKSIIDLGLPFLSSQALSYHVIGACTTFHPGAGILQQMGSLRKEVQCSCSGPLFADAAQAGMGLPGQGLDGGVLQLMGGQRSAPAAK